MYIFSFCYDNENNITEQIEPSTYRRLYFKRRCCLLICHTPHKSSL